jgi:hypothetical protein
MSLCCCHLTHLVRELDTTSALAELEIWLEFELVEPEDEDCKGERIDIVFEMVEILELYDC